jgi:RNA polymerase sigma factor (sigma-70 family)
VLLTRAGSERAFAEIMRRYQRPLYVYCLQLLGAGRAEDAVQQAFLKAFVALRDGASREIALRPWLYRIARNCSIDLLRKQDGDHDELDPEYEHLPQPLAPALFEQKEELAKLVAAILALPEGQRRALTLRELEGRSYGEISAALGHTDSGVRQLIFRARTALRNLAAFAFPLGSLRSRLLGQIAPASPDPHQVAAAATLSTTGGGGTLETVGAILAATVSLAAGGGAIASANGPVEGAAPIRAYAVSPATLAPVANGYLLKVSGTREAFGHRHGSGGAGVATPAKPVSAPALAPIGVPSIADPPAPAPSPAGPSTAGSLPAEPAAIQPATGQSLSSAGTGADGTEARSQSPSASGTSATSLGVPSVPPAAVVPAASTGGAPPKGVTGPSGAIFPPANGGKPAKPILAPAKPAKPVKAPKAPALPKAPKLPSPVK